MKSFIVIVTLVFLFAFGSAWLNWQNTDYHFGGKWSGEINLNLLAIQRAEQDCKTQSGRYCDSLKEMGLKFPAPSAENAGCFSGRYEYSLVRADASSFLAEARYKGSAECDNDVWQVSAEGPPVHVERTDYFRREARTNGYAFLVGFVFLIVFIIAPIKKKEGKT